MQEYIRRLCACGMRVDRAYGIVNRFYSDLDIDGLKEFVKMYEAVREIVERYVD